MSEEIIKIANCSGYYGDKLSAAKEMVDGGPIDVLTGDYLAELTMTILFNQKMQRGEDKGYVGTFLKQVKAVAMSCRDKNIKIVTNAGGLNPSSMANEIEKILEERSPLVGDRIHMQEDRRPKKIKSKIAVSVSKK